MTGLTSVVFDLDGTLAETHDMATQLIGEAIVSAGGPAMSQSEIVELFGRNEQGVFGAVLGENWPAAWDYYLDRYRDRHSVVSSPFGGITDLLEALAGRGIHLAVITAKTTVTGQISVETLGLSHFFESVVGGPPDGTSKRDDLGRLAELWGVSASSLAYVGDTPGDVFEARAAGVLAVGAAWSDYVDEERLEAAGPDALFDSPRELQDWLEPLLAY